MSRSKTDKYVTAAAAAGCAATCCAALRNLQLTWGARPAEAHGILAGDTIIPFPDLQATRAVTIRARAEDVWPWLAQMGQRRAGLYSFDFLENMIGLDFHSADTIHPEWQDIKAGDPFHLGPSAETDLEIALVEPARALVLRVPRGAGVVPFEFTWSFVLAERPDGATRLIIRERYLYRRRWARFLVEGVQLASFVMSVKMLHGIKCRAERASGGRPKRAR